MRCNIHSATTTWCLGLCFLAAMAVPLNANCAFAAEDDAPKATKLKAAKEDSGQPNSAKPQPSKADMEKSFAALMSGAKLVGQFTTAGAKGTGAPKDEEYTLDEVRKLDGEDLWQFKSRIKYGDHDVTVPLTLHVRWAGDTPVISLTKLPVPGLGTFSARVVIYDNQYAGTWSGGDHGGHLFGRIVPGAKTPGIETPPARPIPAKPQ